MKEGIGSGELGEKADWAFHMAIAEASQNPMLTSIMNSVSGMIVETMRETRRIWLFSKQTTTEKLLAEHQAIFEAIRDQNPDAARARMLEHLTNVENVLRRYIRTQQPN